jgi:hypothetical protein
LIPRRGIEPAGSRRAYHPDVQSRAGVALIVSGAGLGLLSGFALRTRLPAPSVLVLLASAGTALAAGALLVQEEASTANWVVTLATMAILAPVHARVMLGPFGSPEPPPIAPHASVKDQPP